MMRVVFINSRLDARQNPGGDTVQVAKTREVLLQMGLVIEERSPEDLGDLSGFDLAHVFNIQMPHATQAVFAALNAAGLRTVLSPIFWDMYGMWYENGANQKLLWRAITRAAGRKMGRDLYIAWQQQKAPRRPDWQAQREVLGQAGRVLPNSHSEALQLQQTFKLGEDFPGKVDVIPNGIDAGLYQDLPVASQSFLERHGVRDFVLQVGTINPVKNQLGLIEALFDLPVPIVIIGHTMSAYRDYAGLCQQLGAERGNVIFIDHLPHDALPGIYALAAVHALPSWRETPGLVSLEAAAAGCRIVTTSIGSTRDYFGDYAWYCDPHNIQSIRTAVEAALAVPKDLALRRHVLDNFTWEHAARTTLEAYQKALRSVVGTRNA
jgi:glycosyltransferase involved in cell wall biosynthesis